MPSTIKYAVINVSELKGRIERIRNEEQSLADTVVHLNQNADASATGKLWHAFPGADAALDDLGEFISSRCADQVKVEETA